ncbi:hypothetical protein ACW5XW_08330 [Aeromonas piscicola]|uniref:hypothetical protein n=1 Tax=Aeromonas piscicola TaxID=600645 RepID=UPI0005B545E9|nr:hypothetical protein [Aeromonas piscicola]
MSDSEEMQLRTFPIEVNSPVRTLFDPKTGELLLECLHPQSGVVGTIQWQIRFDVQATEQLLSSLPTLQKEFGELIALRASKGFLQ